MLALTKLPFAHAAFHTVTALLRARRESFLIEALLALTARLLRRNISPLLSVWSYPTHTRRPTVLAQRHEFFQGEPHNNNPLEKTTKAHDVELSNAVEDAGESIKEGAQKLGDKIKEATGQK